MSQRLQAVFASPVQGTTRLVAYLMAGDPDEERTLRRLFGLARHGADILEVGIPFSDPIADGPVIQAAGQRALAHGMTLRRTLALVREFRAKHAAPVLLMGYLNPLLQFGWEKFVRSAADCGVDGLIIPDLPWREGQSLRQLAQAQVGSNLTFIPMLAQTSRREDIQALASERDGFVYVLSRNGVTGGEAGIAEPVREFIRSLAQELSLPRVIGFGIQRVEQVRRLADVAEGVVVGSALVARFAALDKAVADPAETVRREEEIYTWVESLKGYSE